MSIKTQAKRVQKVGNKNSPQDSILAHINPREAGLLHMMGGSGRTDPKTGMPHYEDTDSAGTSGGPSDFGGPDSWGGVDFGGSLGDNTPADWGLEGLQSIDVTGQRTGDTPGSPSDSSGGIDNEAYATPEDKFKNFYKNLHPVVKTLAGAIPGFAPVKTALDFYTNPAATIGGGLARGAVSALGGGAALGALSGMFGGQFANSMDKGVSVGPQTAAEPGTSASGLADTALGLGGLLYNVNRNKSNLDQQINSLQSMSGPDSPYAQVMRKQLEARDAQAGRRSQYGPREVELQAALAQLYSKNAPQLGVLNQEKMRQRQAMLNTLAYALQKSGGIKGLQNMFSSSQLPGVSDNFFDTQNFGGGIGTGEFLGGGANTLGGNGFNLDNIFGGP